VAHSAVLEERVAVRFAHATRTMAVQPAHQKDAYSAREVRSADAAGSTYANSAVEKTFSPNGCRMGDSNCSGYCSYYCYSLDDLRCPYAPCSNCANLEAEKTFSPNGCPSGGSNSSG
jgi:hypothetical protein